MPIHLLAFSGAKTDSTANESIDPTADAVFTRGQGTDTYIVPRECRVLWALARNDTITRARLNVPSLRDLGMPEIFPLDAQAEPAADFDVCWFGEQGPRLKQTEEFGADVSNGASTVDNATVLVCVTDGLMPVPTGRRTTVRATSTQTLVANAWTLGGLTFDTALPPGRYSVIGMQATCNDAHAARLVFPMESGWRPGVPTGETIAILDPRQTGRNGMFGELGKFLHNAAPQLELLGGTAGAETAAVILDLVQVST